MRIGVLVAKVTSGPILVVMFFSLFARSLAPQMTSEQAAIRALDEAETRRESRLAGYSVTEHYSLRSSRFGMSAEMTVETVYRRGEGDSYHVVSRTGSRLLQSRVFDRLLDEEREMTRGETRRKLAARSDNYAMRLIGEEIQEGSRCYVLELTPRVDNPHLLKGRAWTDREDGSLVRIEGIPSASPSFVTGRPQIIREYQKVGEFWLVKSSRAVSSSLLFGKSELSIEYCDYQILHEETGR